MFKSSVKTILITGAGSGIGRACVYRASQSGFEIYATSRTPEKLEQLKTEIPDITIIPADISSESGRLHIVNSINTEINYVIHNAAWLQDPCGFEELELNDFRKSLLTNVEPLIFLTQNLIPYLSKEKKQTRILCISSGAAKTAIQGITNYCISKAAALMAAECLKAELTQYNILVNNYFPGVVDTDMQKTLRSADSSVFPYAPEFRKLYQNQQLASTEKIANDILNILLKTNDDSFLSKTWDYSKKPIES